VREGEPNRFGLSDTPSDCRRLTSIIAETLQWLCHDRRPKSPEDSGAEIERREESSPGRGQPQPLRRLPVGPVGGHDGWAVARSGGKGGKGGGHKGAAGERSKADREALERAFSDVKPLSRESQKRVMPLPESRPARSPAPGRDPQQPAEPLVVERESNGIVLGKRRSTHSSILDALEDPKLEVQAECDLHGQTAREAEREVLRFVRACQQNGKRWVLIIVGKGLHSAGGKATLQASVANALGKRAPARFVLAFRTAPRHLGGTGALVARLVDRL
jgi:DNA-nicking Smr family endonuclease